MTEFQQLQESKNLTNEAAAKLFKVSERTITRWRTSANEVPESALLVLRSKVAA